jgi:long-chain acyl-CoA synthetase
MNPCTTAGISGGSNIYPREVEEVLLRHPGVREVSVVGQADPQWGEVVVAFVVGEGVGADALDALCLEHIARFKRPKHSCPRTTTARC